MRVIRCALYASLAMLLASSIFAQASRTWVSGVGDDVNPCSRTAPCKTFAGAISKTAVNGEISVLDPGGFGAVTITKAMRIDGHSFVSSALVSGTNDIIINAGSGDVTLQNLELNGIGSGINGVLIFSAGTVTINNCNIVNFTTAGVSAQVTNATKVNILNSQIHNIVGGKGVVGTSTTGELDMWLDHVQIGNVQLGFNTQAHTVGTISNSFLTGCTGGGLQADTASNLNAVNNVIVNCNNAIVSSANSSTIKIAGNFVQQSASAFNVTAPSQIFTAGNNSLQTAGNVGTLQAMGGLQ